MSSLSNKMRRYKKPWNKKKKAAASVATVIAAATGLNAAGVPLVVALVDAFFNLF